MLLAPWGGAGTAIIWKFIVRKSPPQGCWAPGPLQQGRSSQVNVVSTLRWGPRADPWVI